jgi:hypothetical protein
MRTVAKQGFFFKDRATAAEIIMQTEKVLGELGQIRGGKPKGHVK